ncbi:MAG: hypothetical protein IDH49_09845 [Gammaproteobacteria bacterium]|nr:hypothetical protein [Gammaproteobacteria bacterium]
MKDWNIIAIALPEREHFLLEKLKPFGQFQLTAFRGVLTGKADDVAWFLNDLRKAMDEDAEWTESLSRLLPMDQRFQFTLDTLEDQLAKAATPLVGRMSDGTFYVRLEWRGPHLRITGPDQERALGDHLTAEAHRQGKTLHVSFDNPDYIVAAETVDDSGGVTLLSQDLRTRYSFVRVR